MNWKNKKKVKSVKIIEKEIILSRDKMSISSIISSTLAYLGKFSKQRLLEMLDRLRKDYVSLQEENELLKQKVAAYEKSNESAAIKKVNEKINQPSSKQAEWELKGVGNDGKDKAKKRGKQGRKGAGNKSKEAKNITKREKATIATCVICGRGLGKEPVLKSTNTRIIEDIVLPEQTEVIEVKQEKKCCKFCQQVSTARSDKGLPKSDIGIQATIQLVYQWVVLGLSTTRIQNFMKDVFKLRMSTSGISSHLVRVANLLEPVQAEILERLQDSAVIHADETGWRVGGKLWWLWVVGDREWAYYTIEKSRGKGVVRKMLGEIFLGVLVVDGWKSYLSLVCEQQSCMAHLLRKIRKIYAAFPQLRSVFKFYVQFRKILREGEELQQQREQVRALVFQQKLQKLHDRLDTLLAWRNPNDILKKIIKLAKNQRSRTLTFVEHSNVPCHNNYGEYLIRIGVLKRKISGGSKSPKGAKAYATLLSIYTTCKLQGIPFLDFLHKSLQHYTQHHRPLFIQEYIDSYQQFNLNQPLDKAA